MALADYRLCDVCGAKAFYDADLQYDFDERPDTGLYNVGAWAVLCRECTQTHRIIISDKASGIGVSTDAGDGAAPK
jgi:hypothetical protein